MAGHFELFDHTADIGVRAMAPTLAELLRSATDGFYTVIGELTAGASPRNERFEFTDGEPALLLRDYLAELLMLFEHERRMLTAVEVEAFERGCLIVVGESRDVDESTSIFHREAKAVTYHELQVREVDEGYEATFIVDI
jgi:SHS2 domain-containing protein